MREVITWIGGSLTAVLLSFALVIGGQQAFAAGPKVLAGNCDEFCPGDPQLCRECCIEMGASDGECGANACNCIL